jgi:hypothetical protein
LFAKKNQKTFATALTAGRIFHHPWAAPKGKSFCFFLQKEALS